MNDAGELKGFKLEPRGKSSLASQLAEQFRFYDFSLSPMCSGADGFVAEVVDASKGPRISYCLKRHAARKTPAELEAGHAAISRVRSCGFHLLPAAIGTVSGATVFAAGGRLFSLYDFVKSQPPYNWSLCTWGVSECSAAGQALAGMHGAALKSDVGKIEVFDAQVLANIDQWLQSALAKIEGARKSTFSLREDLASALRSNLTEVVAACRSDTPDERCLLHGDYHPGNVLFNKKSQTAGIVDYGDLQLGSRIQDIAYGAVTFSLSTEKENAAATDACALNEARLKAFLTGYESQWKKKSESSAWEAHSLCNWIKLSAYLIIYWCLEKMADRSDYVPVLRAPVELSVRVATGTCAVTNQIAPICQLNQ